MYLYIEGEKINLDELHQWARQRITQARPDWISDIAAALTEWYDDNDHIVVQTSGSTGAPKLIEHSKSSMISSAHKTGAYFGLTAGMTALMCMPSNFIAGKMMLIRAIVLELDMICVEPSLHPLEGINRPIDFIAMTPMQMEMSLRSQMDFSLVDTVILGGAPVSTDLLTAIQRVPTACYLTYGMTETITHVAIRSLSGKGASDVFNAIEGVRFEAPDGRLIIHTDHLDEGTVETTDEVDLIDDQRFRWLGRADNVINSGGLKIHPEAVEDILQPYISTPFLITGTPDQLLGTQLVLVIEGRREEHLDVDSFFNHIENKYHRPKQIIFVDQLQRTPTGKIKRKVDYTTS